MGQYIRVEKNYAVFGLVIAGLIILLFAFLFSSFSRTNVIQSGGAKKSNMVIRAVPAPSGKDKQVLAASDAESDSSNFIIKHGSITNRPFYSELIDHQVPSHEILKLSRDFKKVFDFKCARNGDQYTLFFSKDYNLKKIFYKRNLLTQFVAKKNALDGFDVTKKIITLQKSVDAKEFVIKDSLFRAVLDGGEKESLALDFADIFSWDIDFFLFPRKGDTIQIEFEKFSKDGRFVKYGRILAARYVARNKIFSAFLFNDGKYDNYYDKFGNPMKKMFLRVPIKFGRITSSFSLHRFHPVLKKYKRHTGIDYGARTGTPIFATANGRVRFSGWSAGYGKLVIIIHPNGYETYYGHCSALLVRAGKYVNQGDTIARVGSTGQTTGPHVHYEVRINKKPVNPNQIKYSPGKPLAKKFLPRFKSMVSQRLNLLESVIKLASSGNGTDNKS